MGIIQKTTDLNKIKEKDLKFKKLVEKRRKENSLIKMKKHSKPLASSFMKKKSSK